MAAPTDFAALVERLRARLAGPLPGLAAQLAMAPPTRGDPARWVEAMARARRAAVLLLLYPLDGTPAFVLTLRHAGLKVHAGQVALPGGRVDPGESPVEAALREGWEEVGVPRDTPQVLGTLTDLYIPPSDFTVTPVVASAPHRPPFRARAEEVEALIEVPLPALLDPASRRRATWQLHGADVEVPYFDLAGHTVWGATAMILAELAVLAGG